MTSAIWAISYAIGAGDRPAYAEWFHGMHIPEKLARPGCTGAAHYEALDGSGRCLALFLAGDVRAFLAPTPGQLRERQDELTKKMVGVRAAPVMAVCCEALRVGAPAAPGPAVRFSHFEYVNPAAEDAAAGWLVQQRLPELESAGVGASLLVVAAGRGRHAMLESHASPAALAACPARFPASAAHVANSPFEGRRTWPPLEA